MEVGEDGTRYVNWRLPTAAEINIIIDYQEGTNTSGKTIMPVLTGNYYWALNGESQPTGYNNANSGTATNAYVRCVRDLTLEDIERLNN